MDQKTNGLDNNSHSNSQPVTSPTSEPFAGDYVLGSTYRRFNVTGDYSTVPFFVDDPSTYRPGVGYLEARLSLQNNFECTDHNYRKMYDYYEKVKEVLAEHPTFCDQVLPCLWAIKSFQMLGRLDELPLEPMVDFLLDWQRDDGGFAGQFADPDTPGNVEYTNRFVQVLALVGEQPKNLSALRSFLTGLQRLDGHRELFRGFFGKGYPSSGNISTDFYATLQALSTFRTLGWLVPHRDILLDTTDKWFTEKFLPGYQALDFSEQRYDSEVKDVLNDFHYVVNLAYLLGDQSLLHELKGYGWRLHYLLPAEKFKLPGCTVIGKELTLLGKAAFPPKSYLSPGQLSFSAGRSCKQSFTLRLMNPYPLQFQLRFQDFSVVDWQPEQFRWSGLPTAELLTLPPHASVDLPLELTYRPVASSSQGKVAAASSSTGVPAPPATITLQLVVDRFCYVSNLLVYDWVTSEVFFELPLKEDRDLSPVALGLLIGVPVVGGLAGGTAVALRYHRRRRRQKDHSGPPGKGD